MVQSQYSLSWNDYKSNICNGFSSLQQNGEMVDMTLAADGHIVKVHQVLLALASPYLKELITSAPCQHPVIFLNDVSYRTLTALLEYIYTGEVLVAAENLLLFVKTAKNLHIKGLEDLNIQDENMHIKFKGGSRLQDENMHIKFKGGSRLQDENMHIKFKGGSRLEELGDCHITGTKKMTLPETEGAQVEFTEIEPYKAGSRWFSRDGHFYVLSRTKGSTEYLRCASDRCPAHWSLKNGQAGPVAGQHDHPPTPWVANRNKMFNVLKTRATLEDTQLLSIYEEEARRYPDGAAHLLFEAVESTMRKARRSKTVSKVDSPASARKALLERKKQSEPISYNQNVESVSEAPSFMEDMDDNFEVTEYEVKSCTTEQTETGQLQYSVTIHGSLQVILNRYIYNLQSTQSRSGMRRWRCMDYRNRKCTAFFVTKGNVILNRANLHNHAFHDKKILQKIEKKAVYSEISDIEGYKGNKHTENTYVEGYKENEHTENTTMDQDDLNYSCDFEENANDPNK